MNRDSILDGLLQVLGLIADREFQQKVWVEGEGPQCSSFEDVICDFFSIGEDIVLNHKKYKISDSQFSILTDFYDCLMNYCDHTPEVVDERKILSDPDWQSIQVKAHKVLKAFHRDRTSKYLERD